MEVDWMNCPKCGYSRASYKESRKRRWKGRFGDSGRLERADEPRTNFQLNPCPNCGFQETLKPDSP